jgi:hypothetical protein
MNIYAITEFSFVNDSGWGVAPAVGTRLFGTRNDHLGTTVLTSPIQGRTAQNNIVTRNNIYILQKPTLWYSDRFEEFQNQITDLPIIDVDNLIV